jgi:DedD protein
MIDRDLDDLVFDNQQHTNKKKSKSPLTFFASAIILLILGIVLSKNFDYESEDIEILDENMSSFVAPELQLQNSSINSLEPMPSEALEIAKPTEPSIEALIENKVKTPLEKMQVIEMPIPRKPRTTQVQAPVKEEVLKTIDESLPEKAKEIKKVEKVEKIKKPSPVKNPTPKASSTGKIYYIQVGSFKNTPSKRLISVITSSGFQHTLGKASDSGMRKLLIGPYQDKNQANQALKKIHIRINKGAFIIVRKK